MDSETRRDPIRESNANLSFGDILVGVVDETCSTNDLNVFFEQYRGGERGRKDEKSMTKTMGSLELRTLTKKFDGINGRDDERWERRVRRML